MPKNIHGRGKEPHHKKLVRITFWTPYPTRSGTIHSRIANLTIGQEITIDGNPETYVITSSLEVDTPVWGRVTEYAFTASPETVVRWIARLRLEGEKQVLMRSFRGS